MKKIIISIVILLSTFILFSCEVDKHIVYTAKEQIDYINENLFFENENIKLCYEYPELLDRNYDDELLIKDDEEDSIIYIKYNKDLYDGTTPYSELPDSEKSKIQLWRIEIGCPYSSFKMNNIITYLSSNTENFTFFNEQLGGSIDNIVELLIERGFVLNHEGYSYGQSLNDSIYIKNYVYGSISVYINTLKNKFSGFTVKIENSLQEDELQKTALKGYNCNVNNIIKYAYPFDIIDYNCFIDAIIDVYDNIKTTKYYFTNNHVLFSITSKYKSFYDEDVTYNRKIELLSLYQYYEDEELTKRIPFEKYNDEDYIKQLKAIYEIMYKFKYKTIKFNNQMYSYINSEGVLPEYQYLVNLLYNDPDYIH